MRARAYAPMLGRFMQKDFLFGTETVPQTLNRYSYVTGNPISYLDPLGLSKGKDIAIGIGIGIGIGALIGAVIGGIAGYLAGNGVAGVAAGAIGGAIGGALGGALGGGIGGAVGGLGGGAIGGGFGGATGGTGGAVWRFRSNIMSWWRGYGTVINADLDAIELQVLRKLKVD